MVRNTRNRAARALIMPATMAGLCAFWLAVGCVTLGMA
jgi:hypothetical protein